MVQYLKNRVYNDFFCSDFRPKRHRPREPARFASGRGQKKILCVFLSQASKTRFFLESSNGQVKNTECQQRSAKRRLGQRPASGALRLARRALPAAGCRAAPWAEAWARFVFKPKPELPFRPVGPSVGEVVRSTPLRAPGLVLAAHGVGWRALRVLPRLVFWPHCVY